MSFNRNLKRIAGPSFVINVRYDDHHKMRCLNNTKINPFLKKGRNMDECYDVKEAELLVAYKAQKGAKYMDGYTHCFSSANNFSVDPSVANIDEVKEKILQDVVFVGVASTEFVPRAAYQEQGFVAQVGGVVTVMNESHDTIYPGDKVMLDVSLRANGAKGRGIVQKGIPAEKIRFTVKRAMPTDQLISSLKSTAPKDVIREYQQLQERVIGKSFSYARHGDRMEINLQPRSSY